MITVRRNFGDLKHFTVMLLYLAILCTVKLVSLVLKKIVRTLRIFVVQKESNSIIYKTLNDSIKKQILAVAKVFHLIVSINVQTFVSIKVPTIFLSSSFYHFFLVEHENLSYFSYVLTLHQFINV